MAFCKHLSGFPGFRLQAVTVRRTKNGKAAHLFVDYVNGAVSGHPVAFCGVMTDHHDWKRWKDDGTLPLCNHCGRAWYKERKKWHGLP